MEKNLALKVKETDSPDSYDVFGRGVLHLSVLIETMRREGYELQIGKPRVIIKEIDGVKSEPIELLSIDLPEHLSGKAIELVTQRKGDMTIMEPKGDLMHLEFEIPSRGIIGLRNQILNQTAGEATMTHRFVRFEAWKGEIPGRNKGVLIVHETGTSIPFALFKLQERGKFFIPPGVPVYEGQIAGEHTRDNDLMVNVIKTKKLSNVIPVAIDNKFLSQMVPEKWPTAASPNMINAPNITFRTFRARIFGSSVFSSTFINTEVKTGLMTNATKSDEDKTIIRVLGKYPIKLPIKPGQNAKGTNASKVVKVEAIIGKATSPVPCFAASIPE